MPILRPPPLSISTDSDASAEDRYTAVVETPSSLDPVAAQRMDRLTSMNSNLTDLPGRGLHMPTEVLGQAESPARAASEEPPPRRNLLANVNARARKRSQQAVKALQSQSASAAAAAAQDFDEVGNSSMITLLTYGGVEVVFSTTSTSVVGVCSRTNFVLQTLHLVSEAPVVSLTSNSMTGLIAVTHQDGIIQTYRPTPIDPEQQPLGKYIWRDSLTIDVGKVFYESEETPRFMDRRSAMPGRLVDISISNDFKLLVAHGTQLAVFEAVARQDHNSPRSAGGRLLWTTILPSAIRAAKISGDGQAIVAVLEDDENSDGNFGARTFLHDREDGCTNHHPPTLERSTSIGMVFKPGPFLPHATPVTRISFRGLGRRTSSPDVDEGNDLLLTHCDSESAMRIFNQNGWKQLMIWAAPPNSRADWIRGSSAFSLGDLESEKKSRSSRALSRSPSARSDLSGGINQGLVNAANAASTAAGAWIAEITFRGAFPALRLSRLSYMKRGTEETQPAHFESVAAILPAGSISAGTVLNSDDMGVVIQGVWPAWNPWLSEPTGHAHDQTLRGSAMEFLGLSSVPPPNSAYYGDSYLGGTHSPPTELRVVSSHPSRGNVVIMEFPLWGDDEFGAMELGSPFRSIIALSDYDGCETTQINNAATSDSVDFESSRLCAQVDPGQRTISLLWRKQGTMTVNSSHFLEEDSATSTVLAESAEPKPLHIEDLSLIPAPLTLPTLRLPSGTTSVDQERIAFIKWWPDESFDGPPLLLALTQSANLVVFEIPPPRSAREPSMPNFDPFTGSSHGSFADMQDVESVSDNEDDTLRSEYEVNVTPHPDFGLGLRLESPMDGFPAVAGSFKKHPLNGGMLPAEKTGMIVLGDEVLSVNGVSLDNMTFDDIIATVRHIGAEAGPGQPLALRFRPVAPERVRKNSAILQESFKPVEAVPNADSVEMGAQNRRSIMGVNAKTQKKRNHRRRQSDAASLAALLVGSLGEAQQEFGRVIAVLRQAIPSAKGDGLSNRILINSWLEPIGASASSRVRGSALVLCAEGKTVHVKRLILPVSGNPDLARLHDLGSVDIGAKTDDTTFEIHSLHNISSSSTERSYAVVDNLGRVTLLFIGITNRDTKSTETSSAVLSFRQHQIFKFGENPKDICFRVASISLFITYQAKFEESPKRLTLWTARPDPMCRRIKTETAVEDPYFGQDYVQEEIIIPSGSCGSTRISNVVALTTGHLDSFPSIAVLLQEEAFVFQRRGGGLNWTHAASVSFPSLHSSLPSLGCLSLRKPCPQNAYPHLMSLIQCMLPSYNECSYLVSDWHPESLLAYLCTDTRGAKIALEEHVKKILTTLSELVDRSSSYQTILSRHSPILVVPFDSAGGPNLLKQVSVGSDTSVARGNTASALFGGQATAATEEDTALKKLQGLVDILGKPRNFVTKENDVSKKRSQEFKLAMAVQSTMNSEDDDKVLPAVFDSFSGSELRVLWAIADVVIKAPDYGKLDTAGQHAFTMFTLHSAMKRSPSNCVKNATPISPYVKGNLQSFYQLNRSSSGLKSQSKLSPQSASSAAVAALMSDYQGLLVEFLRPPGSKFDWDSVREMRIPIWVRSDDKLRQLSEEVGQHLYRESRDILKCAIFFLAAGKLRTLRNLAAADSTESGKKFFKFLTSYDFASERGRTAAEKNAFSLLRKNKYDSAAAFFLLAEPPLLKSAVETIATKMEDLDLAFLVSRLIGNAQATLAPGLHGLGGGIGFGGGIIGGGGGYAGGGAHALPEVTKDEESFQQWHPTLREETLTLVMNRMLPHASDDGALSALLLLWIGRREEAWHWLSGFIENKHGMVPSVSIEVSACRIHETTKLARKSKDPTMTMVNSFVNFASGPLILKLMGAAPRTLIASVISVSSSLCRLGVELPALQSLERLANKDLTSAPHDVNISSTPKALSCSKAPGTTDSSLIFDSFALPSVSKSRAHQPTSSIFDDFDGPPREKEHPVNNGGMESSIFDTFSTPPQQKLPSNKGTMSSSIFDSFDTGPPPPKPHLDPCTGTASSSIFDSFEPAPTIRTITRDSSGGEMNSSIFDSFGAAPQGVVASATASNGQMESSIFDSFNPPKPKPHHEKPPNGNVQSSIFDAFDVPPTSVVRPAQATSSVPNSDVGAPRLPPEPIRDPPKLWEEWRRQLHVECVARRLVRELACVGARFHIDIFKPNFSVSGAWHSPFIPHRATEALQFLANGDAILNEVKMILKMVGETSGIDTGLLVEKALHVLEAPFQYHRTCLAVLLHLSVHQLDRAEDVVRTAAQALIEKCCTFSLSRNMMLSTKKSLTHVTSLVQRQAAVHFSWQLELCLWLHRGGALPLTGLSLNETICAVRIGMLVAGWDRDYEVLETLVRQPPDCLLDHKAGRQLWTSLKMISNNVAMERKASGVGSGGWEFLVDCKRSEATEMLRPRPTGCFLIRPHPEDHGVFTLSFKTNLKPTENSETPQDSATPNEIDDSVAANSAKPIKQADVVQHAIIRLSDSGFRCGSFGPFATLMKLLDAVSASLPFKLRFDMPPTEGVIKEEGSRPSPNCAFFRKLALLEGKALMPEDAIQAITDSSDSKDNNGDERMQYASEASTNRRRQFGLFLELLVLSEVRKQLSSIAAANYDNHLVEDGDVDSVGSVFADEDLGLEHEFAVAARTIRPLLTWCRIVEMALLEELAPHFESTAVGARGESLSFNESEGAIELTEGAASGISGGDGLVRKMIKSGSGVEFRTLRIGDGGETSMVVLFSKNEAVQWLLSHGEEDTEEGALNRLDRMEKDRVIESVNLKLLAPKSYRKTKQNFDEKEHSEVEDEKLKGIRYRLVDPWEVEPLESREAETRGAALGRHRFLAFGLGKVSASCENIFRSLGGLQLLELWTATNGVVSLTKAIATIHSPWERDAGGDLQLKNGIPVEPQPFDNSIRQHLYRNALFRKLGLPQRFVVLIQVELLDLKNLTSPGGSLSMTAYALLRLKRPNSKAPLTTKARTLDSVSTHPAKLGKVTGPNAPASWGSLVRFRFPLPEDTGPDGKSYDFDREVLFKGPPSVLQLAVYEKKFMSDTLLGGADVKLDGLSSGGQLEEWVPLRTDAHGISWFARIRLTLRFELMCLSSEKDTEDLHELAPSVGFRRMKQLSGMGGLHEDVRKSISTPDLLSYFESMVY